MKTALPSRLVLCALLAASSAAVATTPADVRTALAAAARAADPAFKEFSAERGEAFYRSRQGGEWRCSSACAH